jgi:hypothetical protein
VLSGLVASATSAGVPAEVMTPMRQIVDSGEQPPAEAIKTLKEACSSPTPTS